MSYLGEMIRVQSMKRYDSQKQRMQYWPSEILHAQGSHNLHIFQFACKVFILLCVSS